MDRTHRCSVRLASVCPCMVMAQSYKQCRSWSTQSLPGPGVKDIELVIVNTGGSPLSLELWGAPAKKRKEKQGTRRIEKSHAFVHLHQT